MKKKRLFLLLNLIFTLTIGYSQKIQKVSATYTYYAPETMSVEEAKRKALEGAKIQAIADEFGTIISQNTSMAASESNGQSNTHFFSLTDSDVKGEWIETIGEPVYDLQFDRHMLVVACSIKGKAREIVQAKVDFIARPLKNGTTLKYESTEFKNGDDLYLYFKSPVDGYLTVFLVDETAEAVQCALPYSRSDGNPMLIKADKEYVLFSKKDCDFTEKRYVDEYVMTSNADLEYNDFYILFSTEPFAKATLENNQRTSMPKTMNLTDFQTWLAKTRTKNANLSLRKVIISITK